MKGRIAFMSKIREGETLFKEGNLDEAEDLFVSLLSEDPENTEILNNLGVIHHAKRNIKDSEDCFVKALSTEEKNLDALLNLADLYQEQGRFGETVNCLEKYISIETKDIDILNRLGLIYLKRDDASRAEEVFKASLKLNPEQKNIKQHLEEITQKGGIKFQIEEKKRLLFLELPGIGNFLDHITKNLKKNYHVKHIKTTEQDKIIAHINWADIVWLEWANEMAIHVTNKISQIKNKTVICRLHGYEVFTDMPAQIDWSVVDLLVFVAKHKQDIFNNKFKVQSLPQTVIRNGINTTEFTIADKKRNTKRLVFLGHLNFRKGLHMLLQFFHQLLKHDPEYYLYIRGEFQDQRLEMSTRTMIRELSLTNKLEFVHWVNDLNTWLSDKSHILSFSIEESFHYAVGNGMAAGLKPVIHAWNESREIWPEDYIFNDLDSFINIMLDKNFEPHHYRQMLFDNSLDYKHQIFKIEELLKTHVEKEATLIQESGPETSINNRPEILDKKPINKNMYFSNNKRNIYIIGLRRSGTTIFWNTIRQDKRFVCYDEPFNPHLRAHIENGKNNEKKTNDEYLARPDLIKKYWSSIQPYEETYVEFLGHQVNYLKELIKTSPNICVDFVRCHAKIQNIKKIDPEGLIIHLVRDPRAFVTSHLKPYGKWISPDLPKKYFKYDGWFDFWQYQTLSNVLGLKGFAHEKLLQLWKHFFIIAEQQKPHITIQFENFATDAEAIIKEIYKYIDLEYIPLDYSEIHAPNAPLFQEHDEWENAFNKFNISNEFVFKAFDMTQKMKKAALNTERIENLVDKNLKSEKQILIGGTGRSGTTLLKKLLNTHKKIASFGETKVFDVAIQFLNQLKHCSKEDKEKEVRLFKKRWINDLYHFTVPWSTQKDNGARGLHMWFTKEEVQTYLPILDGLAYIQSEKEACRIFGNFINHLFTIYAKNNNKPFWSEKTPSNAVHVSFFTRCFGNLKLINVVRDGRDVACSLMKVPWGVKDPREALDWWANNLLQAIEAQSGIPKNTFLNVRYEDVVFRMEETLKEIMKFFDIEWDDCLLEFKVSSDSIGRYKQELSSDVQEYAKKRYGNLLKAFQYSV